MNVIIKEGRIQIILICDSDCTLKIDDYKLFSK